VKRRPGARQLRGVVVALAVLSAVGTGSTVDAAAADTERATRTPIKHFVFLMQENHSFDNYFGTRPGVDGIPRGVCMPITPGRSKPCVKPFHIGDRGVSDLEHTEAAFRAQYNNGKMDGFVYGASRRGQDGDLTMGYYDDRDLPFYWNIADEYVIFDRFFSSASSGSVRNHMYRVAGHPGALKGESIPSDGWGNIPTIFDRLEQAGVSWKFYVQNYDPTITFRNRAPGDADRGAQAIWVPLLSYARYVDDPKLSRHIVDLDEYYTDLANGTLPAVAYIAPSGASEHPPGNIQSGQTFVRSLLVALMRSKHWSHSAFLWSYDDWGGWYDHVKPPRVDEYGYGFRVPALLVSAYAKRGHVDSTTLDFTSPLKFIQHNWNLPPLASRDARANNFLSAFDFSNPPRRPVLLPLERNPAPPPTYHRWPVYAAYTVVLCLVTALVTVAAVRQHQTRALDEELDQLLDTPIEERS
jgi:phospholipase C